MFVLSSITATGGSEVVADGAKKIMRTMIVLSQCWPIFIPSRGIRAISDQSADAE